MGNWQRDLDDLTQVLDQIGRYPIRDEDLLAAAKQFDLSPKVMDFLETIPDEIVFDSPEDVLARFEEVALWEEEEREQPAKAPESLSTLEMRLRSRLDEHEID